MAHVPNGRLPSPLAMAVVLSLVASTQGCFFLKITSSGHVSGTLKVFARFSADTGGVSVESSGAASVPGDIKTVFATGVPAGQPVDLVFVVDATGSMRDDIDAVRADMHSILETLTSTNPDRRLGIVVYRDIGDDFVSKTVLKLTEDESSIVDAINGIDVDGGGDTREHVYAGIDTALTDQPWRPEASQHIVLMGDAPPHDDYADDPRTYDSVIAKAKTPPLDVAIHTIGIQCDEKCQAGIAAGL
jgi:Mg-chelatase subunit ChlD